MMGHWSLQTVAGEYLCRFMSISDLYLNYLEEVPYDVLEVLHIIVCPVDVVEPRNLDFIIYHYCI